MELIKGIVGAIIGALIGAAIWAIVAYQSGYEVGWIAWGVGGLAGVGMMVGAREITGLTTGSLAAVIALGGVIGGKYFAAVFTLDDILSAQGVTADLDHEGVISYVADQVVEEREAAGQIIQWPDDDGWHGGLTAEDYPADIWREAEQRWDSWPTAYQNDFRRWAQDEHRTRVGAAKWVLGGAALPYMFSVFDLLWFGLALATAFKLGAGFAGED